MNSDWLLTRPAFPVQIEAIKKANRRARWLHLLEQGLGKTSVAYNEVAMTRAAHAVSAAIVICPSTLRRNWVDEAEYLPDPRSWAVMRWSPNWQKDASVTPAIFPIWVINYEAIRKGNRGWDFINQMIEHYRTDQLPPSRIHLIVDETSCIKNPKSEQAKAVLKIASECRIVRGLTGQPITQGPQDIWAQLRLAGCKFSNFYAFRNRFCIMGGYQSRQVVGSKNEPELTKLISKHGWRATKEVWAKHLPPKNWQTSEYSMSGKQFEAYRTMEDEFWVKVEAGELSVEHAITQATKLQQISTGFVYNEDKKAEWFGPKYKSGKLSAAFDLCDFSSNKAILFAHYQETVLALIHQARERYGDAGFARLIGGMDPDDVQEERNRLNTDPQCRFIVCQLQAGKFGHTLIGEKGVDRCNTVVFVENTYDLDTRGQAEDRPHRHGADQPITYWDLAGSRTDVRMTRALQRKIKISEAIMEPLEQTKMAW